MAHVRHLLFHARMRPVAAPDQAVGIRGNQCFVEALRIRIIRRDAADAMRA
jgi:hypothetical protein